MTCKICGKQLPEGSTTCKYCGARVKRGRGDGSVCGRNFAKTVDSFRNLLYNTFRA